MSVERRTRPDGKPAWLVRYRDSEGKQRSKTFKRKADADLHWAEVQATLARGGYVGSPASITVAGWAREYWGSQHYRATTRREKAKIIARLEADPLGAIRLCDVRSNNIREYAHRQKNQDGGDGRATGQAGLGPKTLQLHMGYLRSLFRAATLEEPPLLHANPVPPWDRLGLPKPDRSQYVPMTREEVWRLAGAVAPRYRAMVLAQAGLGLRLGEVIALRVADVDFLRRVVHVRDQLEPGTLRRVRPKTDASRRDVPLPEWLRLELARHIELYPPGTGGLLFTVDTSLSHDRSSSRPPDALDHQHVGKTIRRAIARAGLPPGRHSHDLRKHYASMLVTDGAPERTVARMLGHASTALVQEVYGHMIPGAEEQVRRSMERLWRDPAAAEEGAS